VAPADDYWFPAKTYGWGWGPPIRWQGWAVLAVFVLTLVSVTIIADPAKNPGAFVIGVFVASSALIAICWRKGEPPRWRWGSRVTSEPCDPIDSRGRPE
jgi:hypothetical protein